MDNEDFTLRWLTMSAVEHVAAAARIMATNGPVEVAQVHATMAVAKGGTTTTAVRAFLAEATQ
jgi:hypothetical protein